MVATKDYREIIMASEFVRRVRHVEDINTFSKWGLEEGDLVLTTDNKMYALIGQEWKQLDNMEKVWDTGEAGKYLMVGNDGIVKPMVIDDIRKGDNTWVGKNIFTQPINATIQSIDIPNGTDLYTLIKPGINYIARTQAIASSMINTPKKNTNAFSIQTIDISGFKENSWAGTKLVFTEYLTGDIYWSTITRDNTGKISVQKSWSKVAEDEKVLHNTGNETSSGDKTFNGQTTLLNGNFGLRVTNTGIVKTTDGGKNWTSL